MQTFLKHRTYISLYLSFLCVLWQHTTIYLFDLITTIQLCIARCDSYLWDMLILCCGTYGTSIRFVNLPYLINVWKSMLNSTVLYLNIGSPIILVFSLFLWIYFWEINLKWVIMQINIITLSCKQTLGFLYSKHCLKSFEQIYMRQYFHPKNLLPGNFKSHTIFLFL